MNSDNPDVWRAEAEDKIARMREAAREESLRAAALKQLPSEEVKLRQQIEVKDAEITELNKRIDNLSFRLAACKAMAEQLNDGFRPVHALAVPPVLTKIIRFADINSKL